MNSSTKNIKELAIRNRPQRQMTLMEFTEKDLKTDSLNMYRICRKRSTTERRSRAIWPKKKRGKL